MPGVNAARARHTLETHGGALAPQDGLSPIRLAENKSLLEVVAAFNAWNESGAYPPRALLLRVWATGLPRFVRVVVCRTRRTCYSLSNCAFPVGFDALFEAQLAEDAKDEDCDTEDHHAGAWPRVLPLPLSPFDFFKELAGGAAAYYYRVGTGVPSVTLRRVAHGGVPCPAWPRRAE